MQNSVFTTKLSTSLIQNFGQTKKPHLLNNGVISMPDTMQYSKTSMDSTTRKLKLYKFFKTLLLFKNYKTTPNTTHKPMLKSMLLILLNTRMTLNPSPLN